VAQRSRAHLRREHPANDTMFTDHVSDGDAYDICTQSDIDTVVSLQHARQEIMIVARSLWRSRGVFKMRW
jgi:hypothetical protein